MKNNEIVTYELGEILIGQEDNEDIYLTPPSWCGWYWEFGYLGNTNCHYHVSNLMETSDLDDGFIDRFGDSLTIKEENLWTVYELFATFYDLKKTAEVLGRGGANYTI